MFADVIFEKLWLILPIWVLVYLSDYYLTILGARAYEAGAKEHLLFEGSYELTPTFQKDVDALRVFSPKFLRAVLLTSGFVAALWYLEKE